MKRQLLISISILLTCFSTLVSAVEYELPDINGKKQSLDQYLGKWVVVNYWTTWCHTCIKEIPDLTSLHESHKDKDIAVIGVNFETINPKRLKAFVTKYAIPYPIWLSDAEPVTPIGNVPALPATYIVDPKGKVVAGQIGIVTRQDLEDYISQKKTLDIYQ